MTSIPRWAFGRSLESKTKEGSSNSSFGMVKATNIIFDLAKTIIEGGGPLVEVLINDEVFDGVLRWHRCKALLSSLLYVFNHNSRYRSPPWKLLKGEIDWGSVLLDFRTQPCCCEEGGFRKKIFSYLSNATGDKAPRAEMYLKEAFDVANEVALVPGGFNTKEAEGSFSLCRMNGLENPYRSTQLSTRYREVCLRWLSREQRSFIDKSDESYFGGKDEIDILLPGNKSTVNSFGVFMRRVGKMAPVVSETWPEVRQSTKFDMRDEAVSSNVESNDEYTERETE